MALNNAAEKRDTRPVKSWNARVEIAAASLAVTSEPAICWVTNGPRRLRNWNRAHCRKNCLMVIVLCMVFFLVHVRVDGFKLNESSSVQWGLVYDLGWCKNRGDLER